MVHDKDLAETAKRLQAKVEATYMEQDKTDRKVGASIDYFAVFSKNCTLIFLHRTRLSTADMQISCDRCMTCIVSEYDKAVATIITVAAAFLITVVFGGFPLPVLLAKTVLFQGG